MKLRLKDHSAPPFDVASGQAQLYLDSGKYEKFIPATPTRVQNIRWHIRPARAVEHVLDSPDIVYDCLSCGCGGTLNGPTCHKTQVVRCCGGSSHVPADIGEEYAKQRKAWESTHRRVVEAKAKSEAEKERRRQELIRQENLQLSRKL